MAETRGLFAWLKRKLTPAPKQWTFVYCPACRFELCAGGEHLGMNSEGLETYRCAKCGEYSAWDFDAPVPLLIHVDGRPRDEWYALAKPKEPT